MKIVFIINNKNNRLTRLIPEFKKGLQESEFDDTTFLFTERAKHAVELARIATENGSDLLIAVGGDGTLNEVVNGVLTSKKHPDKYPVLGLLPSGSANDFARAAGISNNTTILLDRIKSGQTRSIDLGKIALKQTGEIRYFVNVAGVGLGAEVAQSLEDSSSFLGSGFNYFRHIIRGFINYRKKQVRCKGDSWQWEGNLLQMAVGNGRFFGNGICIAPDANFRDGQFQVAFFGDLSIWDYFKNLGKLRKCKKIDHSEVNYYHTKEVFILSENQCGIEADGEYVGLAPATISVMPKAISFLMPLYPTDPNYKS